MRISSLVPKKLSYFFQNGDGGHIGFRGLDNPKFKNNNFIGFVLAKIEELDILCIFPACLVTVLSNLKFFEMVIGSHFVMLIR